jgi:hypothetical protein
MNKNNWHDANQLEYTLGELQTMFDTRQVADMLDGMVLDGYTAMSLGLIIDLIKQRCPEVDTRHGKRSPCCNAATSEVNVARTVGRAEYYDECNSCGHIS